MRRKRGTATAVFLFLSILILLAPVSGFAQEQKEETENEKENAIQDSVVGELLGEEKQESREAISRQEFFSVIAQVCYMGEDVSSVELPFEDASEVDQSLNPYIQQAYVMGILAGAYDGGKRYIQPEKSITRQDASAILGRALGVASEKELSFTDREDIDTYAYAYIAGLEQQEIISGYPDGSFCPEDAISYQEADVLCEKTRQQQEVLRSLAGTGSAGYHDGASLESQFMFPKGMAFFADGSLVIADTHNSLLRKINMGSVTTISGSVLERDENGFAKAYCLDSTLRESLLGRPYDVVFDAGGSMVFTDMENHSVKIVLEDRLYTLSGGQGSNAKGYQEGPAGEALYNSPTGLASDRDSNIFVADTMNHCIRKIDFNGQSSLFAGTPGRAGYADGSGNAALFSQPMGMDIDDQGNLYVADSANHCIRKITPEGVVTTVAGVPPTAEGDTEKKDGSGSQPSDVLSTPKGVCVAGDVVFIADTGNNAVKVLRNGNVTTVLDETAGLKAPYDVGYQDGKLYVADTQNHRILVIRYDGRETA